jgi:hypothetical protein
MTRILIQLDGSMDGSIGLDCRQPRLESICRPHIDETGDAYRLEFKYN